MLTMHAADGLSRITWSSRQFNLPNWAIGRSSIVNPNGTITAAIPSRVFLPWVVGVEATIGQMTVEQLSVLTEAARAVISDFGGGGSNMPQFANRGSTGRTTPNNLNEQIAMDVVKSNPLDGATQIPLEMTDVRWPSSEGWVKMQRVVNFSDGTHVTIHFNHSRILNLVDDFKFVFPH